MSARFRFQQRRELYQHATSHLYSAVAVRSCRLHTRSVDRINITNPGMDLAPPRVSSAAAAVSARRLSQIWPMESCKHHRDQPRQRLHIRPGSRGARPLPDICSASFWQRSATPLPLTCGNRGSPLRVDEIVPQAAAATGHPVCELVGGGGLAPWRFSNRKQRHYDFPALMSVFAQMAPSPAF